MKKILFVLIACSLILTSCGPDPVKFNDSLIDYVDKAHNQTNSLEDLVTEASNSGNFSQVATSVPPVVDSLNVYIKGVDAIKAPRDGEDFKAEVVSYLNSLITMVESYKTISNITEESTQEDIDAITEAITTKENEAEKLFDGVQKRQVTFASKNNMKLK